MNIVIPDSHRGCVACGSTEQNEHSLQLRFSSISPSEVRANFCLGETFQGYIGVLHGGIISTLLDSAMTHCLFHLKVEAMTADLQVRFIKPVPINTQLIVSAVHEGCRRGIHNLTSCIEINGETLVTARAKFLSPKK